MSFYIIKPKSAEVRLSTPNENILFFSENVSIRLNRIFPHRNLKKSDR